MEYSSRYTVLFALAVCAVCSVFVATSAVSLKGRQVENQLLDVQTKVLALAGLMQEGEDIPREEVKRRFESGVEPQVVELTTGRVAEDIDPLAFDQRQAASDPDRSHPAPPNPAKVRRIPTYGLVYRIVDDGRVESLILPVQGKGLWSTLYGFIALSDDTSTIEGITFYEHGETPGLGGEVDNPRWKRLWKGRKAFDEQWEPRVSVVKGAAGPPEEDPYHVDGLSGATITSRGVTALVQFWLGDEGFGPYLAQHRAEKEI